MKKANNISKTEIGKWLEDDSSPDEKVLQVTEDAILKFAAAHAVAPGPALKNIILDKLKSLNAFSQTRETLHLEHLPILDESSNWMDWEEVVRNIQPPADFIDVHMHELEVNDQRELYVAWVKEYIDEEVHTDIIESFLLLQGNCECHITDANGNTRVVRLGVGDYITMLPGETHDVMITSLEPAKAILQWKKLNAA